MAKDGVMVWIGICWAIIYRNKNYRTFYFQNILMKHFFFLFVVFLLPLNQVLGQSVQDLINEVSQAGIMQMVSNLSGEDTVKVSGRNTIIKHRVSSRGNDLAADYLKEQLNTYGLSVADIHYRTGGRNIVATQTGTVNPDKIYIVCAHYDTVTDYGADDNASGTTAVLESARILSNYNFENTIIYALWDEEEIGLVGAKDYANKAAENGDDILGVLNMDMMAYDGDSDKLFDIDVQNIANSYQIRDDLIEIVSTYGLDLVPNVVDPGTTASDHAAFWSNGYSALLLGEAWSVNDVTPGYHNINDRVDLLNEDYFYNMVKLCVGYIATKGVLMKSVGLDDFSTFQYRIFPNPTGDVIHLDFGKPIEARLELWSLNGQLIKQRLINGQQLTIDLEEYEANLYLLKVRKENGQSTELKLVKQ